MPYPPGGDFSTAKSHQKPPGRAAPAGNSSRTLLQTCHTLGGHSTKTAHSTKLQPAKRLQFGEEKQRNSQAITPCVIASHWSLLRRYAPSHAKQIVTQVAPARPPSDRYLAKFGSSCILIAACKCRHALPYKNCKYCFLQVRTIYYPISFLINHFFDRLNAGFF